MSPETEKIVKQILWDLETAPEVDDHMLEAGRSAARRNGDVKNIFNAMIANGPYYTTPSFRRRQARRLWKLLFHEEMELE